MSDVLPNDPQEASGAGLQPLYKTYARQKCFIGYSERAPWAADLLEACATVLQEPAFNLEADYARKHLSSDTPLREKALELIANARCGIYDISHWRVDARSPWLPPRNVFIELGIAVALNRPALLLRHAENAQAGLTLPKCLESLPIVEWTGDITLKQTLRAVLPQWIRQDPERAWWHRHCTIGGSDCKHRESHPRARSWTAGVLRCHIADGHDVDQADFRAGVERELGRFDVVEFEHLDALPPVEGYRFLLCSHCQAVRSNRFAIYRITSQTAAETYLAIGLSIGLEKQFGYRIPKVTFAESAEAVPSLLAGYDVVTGQNNRERTTQLAQFMPEVIIQIRQMPWRPSPLPFISTTDASEDDLRLAVEREEGEVPTEAPAEPGDVPRVEDLVAEPRDAEDQGQPQATAPRACPNCGTANRAEAKFCARCGSSLGASSTQSGPLTPGIILHQRYQLVRLISEMESMSIVYEVKDFADSPPSTWTMKELRQEGANTREYQERLDLFDREADYFESLTHRNIPRFRERFDENGRVYLVLEYVQGESLDKILVRRAEPIKEEETLAWAVQLCDVLDYLHNRHPPIIYRDLRPANIMIADDGTVKVIDFAIARTYNFKDTLFMGTDPYAPPEQFGKQQTDARVDIYALGATMFHLLTNQYPPLAWSPEDPTPVQVVNPRVSRKTSDIVLKAMQKDRSQRYQSASEMREAIAGVRQAPVLPSQPSVDVSAAPMACAFCGRANWSNSRFCSACGSPLHFPSPEPKHTTGALLLSTKSQLRGRYVIEGILGQGSTGAVYVARDRLLELLVAVKEMNTAAFSTPEDRRTGIEAFRLEATMMAKLNHPSIPRLLDSFEESGRWYMVITYVEGQTLASLLAASPEPLPPAQVIAWGEQLCDVLAYLHSQRRPIIFRDVKPYNIIINSHDVVKLIDFSIARYFTPGKKFDTVAIGTPGYAPPEQYGKAQTDARSDIYALGATMHYMLSGRDPEGLGFDFPELTTLNQLVPPELSFIVHKSLRTDPNERYQSAEEMKQALLGVHTGRTGSPSLPGSKQRSQPRRWPWQRSGEMGN